MKSKTKNCSTKHVTLAEEKPMLALFHFTGSLKIVFSLFGSVFLKSDKYIS